MGRQVCCSHGGGQPLPVIEFVCLVARPLQAVSVWRKQLDLTAHLEQFDVLSFMNLHFLDIIVFTEESYYVFKYFSFLFPFWICAWSSLLADLLCRSPEN
ncbi:hypothetical protein KC19_5G087300 [Ceratodon purpureus]|uniref:Uncharacterized protein n=1 Tax=Ceratodon purpureus TaxID=3225 RepID=A0A8T0HZC8_CERPU|nr:hypothetical protein KC19_5G087300 [Ceratodon purpureus]